MHTNWITFEDRCPVCHEDTRIVCAAITASSWWSFAGERLCDRTYELGERMAWWPPEHAAYNDWRYLDRYGAIDEGDNCVSEACHGRCQACSEELCAVILFCDLVPCLVLRLVSEAAWPGEYPK